MRRTTAFILEPSGPEVYLSTSETQATSDMHSVGSIKGLRPTECLGGGGGSPRSILRLGSVPGRSHRARWRWPFHHNHEQHAALVPTANPADAPAINPTANGDFSEEPQKLRLNLHGDPCIPFGGSAVKGRLPTNFIFQKGSD
jgi:hypothetical protein